MHASNPSAAETEIGGSLELIASLSRLFGSSRSMRPCLTHQGGQYSRKSTPRFPCVLYMYALICAHEPQTYTCIYRNSYTQVQKDKEWSKPHCLSNLRDSGRIINVAWSKVLQKDTVLETLAKPKILIS